MITRAALAGVILAVVPLSAQGVRPDYSLGESQTFVKTYCESCHQGAKAPARLDLTVYATDPDAVMKDLRAWGRVLERVREASMPPKGMPAPSTEERERFAGWVETGLRASVCAAGATPGAAPIRRLNRSQYSNTIRDLLEIQFDAGRGLPEDGAGGEGFDNAAETLFLSPIHAEKYLASAKETINFAFKNPRTRAAILIARPGAGLTASDAARKVLERFLLRAFRRPPSTEEVARYLSVFSAAQKRGETFDASMAFTLEAVLIAPDFLFRIEQPNAAAEARPVGDYELASRLSYFLWNSMPDQQLFDLAAQGTLHDPAVLKKQIVRMLDPGVRSQDVEDDVRLIKGGKVEAFAQQFVEQWLGTRELGRDIQPDQKLFPQFYETETQAAIRMEPVLFMKELLASNLSVLNFLDSKFVVINGTLAKLYSLNVKAENYHSPVELPANSHRGGLTGMSAILAVSSHADRTSPVLRGKWVLEALLGTPPPPPPPNVPALEEAHAGANAKSLRERLSEHRKSPACASCHQRIDPLGFGLENYDVLGRWRTEEESGATIDATGELPDGTRFDGPVELKAMLMSRKDVFVRHLTSKMLGYALGRGLTLQDSCTVDAIVATLKQDDYKAQTLLNEIVLSVPFRFKEAVR
jgi:hypothetical protein